MFSQAYLCYLQWECWDTLWAAFAIPMGGFLGDHLTPNSLSCIAESSGLLKLLGRDNYQPWFPFPCSGWREQAQPHPVQPTSKARPRGMGAAASCPQPSQKPAFPGVQGDTALGCCSWGWALLGSQAQHLMVMWLQGSGAGLQNRCGALLFPQVLHPASPASPIAVNLPFFTGRLSGRAFVLRQGQCSP